MSFNRSLGPGGFVPTSDSNRAKAVNSLILALVVESGIDFDEAQKRLTMDLSQSDSLSRRLLLIKEVSGAEGLIFREQLKMTAHWAMRSTQKINPTVLEKEFSEFLKSFCLSIHFGRGISQALKFAKEEFIGSSSRIFRDAAKNFEADDSQSPNDAEADFLNAVARETQVPDARYFCEGIAMLKQSGGNVAEFAQVLAGE